MPSFSPPFLRRSARLAGRSPGAGAHLNAHRVVLDGEDMPRVEGHALAFVEEEADMPNAAPPEPLPSAREVAAAEAARARLYGDEALRLSGGGAVPLLPPGPPPSVADVPILATADLPPLTEDISTTLTTALAELSGPSTDWATTARALEMVRRGVVHHASAVPLHALRPALAGVVTSMLSLRSALCRAGLAAATDLVSVYGRSHPWVVLGGDAEEGDDATAPSVSFTPLLPPLITKAGATDKKFIVDAAAAALALAASGAVSSAPLAAALLPHASGAKNPRVRAAAGAALALSARRMTAESDDAPWPPSTSSAALATASNLITDAWPAARVAGRDLTAALRAGWEAAAENAENARPLLEVEAGASKDGGAASPPPTSSWSAHCVAVLGERGAAAVGRA